MGCTNSETITPFNSVTNSPAVSCTQDSIKQKVLKCIRSDSVLDLTLVLQHKQLPLNAEISDLGMKWMMVHYCCRYDADNCLEYLLKNYFVEKGAGYLDYVNARTAEGYTPLHLCAMWKGEKAFAVLYYYGGLNLGSRDKLSKTALDLAYQHQCKEMTRVLMKWRELSVYFTIVENQRLTSGKIICEDPLEQRKRRQANKSDNTKVQIQSLETEEQKKLKEERKRIESEADQVLRMKLKMQAELKAEKDKIAAQKQQYEKQIEEKLHQKLRSQRDKFRMQLDDKDKELAKVNKQLKNIEAQKIEEERLRVMDQTEEYIKNNEAMIKEMIKIRDETVTKIKQKENPENADPEQNSNQDNGQDKHQRSEQQKKKMQRGLAETFSARKEKLPQKIERLYAKAQQDGVFVDEEFPADLRSIGDSSNQNFSQFEKETIWLRPSQIFNSKQYQLFNQIQSDDVLQGRLGVCYMLATISSLASSPKLIENMFVFSDLKLGFYVIRMYIHGEPTYFALDDQIPCYKSSRSPVFTRPVGNQLWVMLVEKVWAKSLGSYLNSESGLCHQVMENFTGAPACGAYLQLDDVTYEDHMRQLINHCESSRRVVLSSTSKQIKGIVNGHAYSLLSCFQHQSGRIFKIRNPWGHFQWQGQYSQKSQKLTPQIKQLIGYTNQDDGVFYMSQLELMKGFMYYAATYATEIHYHNHIPFTTKREEDRFFRFTITIRDYTDICVTQKLNGMISDPQHKYSPLILQLGRIEKDNTVTFLSEAQYHSRIGDKSIHAYDIGDFKNELEPGTYFVRVRMFWKDQAKHNSGVFVVYAAEQLQIEQLDAEKGLEYLKKLYYSHALNSRSNTISNQGTWKIVHMKGQFNTIAQTENEGNYLAEFQFTEGQLKGRIQLGKASDTKIAVKVSKGKPGVGSVAFPEIGDGHVGQFKVTFTEI